MVVLPGRFPGEGGIVAPGMSCQYTVRFAPDSLSDYEDFLVVETQAQYPLLVPVEARRPPPILTCECFWTLGLQWFTHKQYHNTKAHCTTPPYAYWLGLSVLCWRTVPSVLDCGYCLVGGVKFVEFLCCNEGLSAGTFCVIPKSQWPASNLRVNHLHGSNNQITNDV